MKRILFGFWLLAFVYWLTVSAQFQNPMLFDDVPDHDIILVGDTY